MDTQLALSGAPDNCWAAALMIRDGNFMGSGARGAVAVRRSRRADRFRLLWNG